MASRDVDVGDLRIFQEMLRTMYDVLHADQPECAEHGEMDLVVQTPSGQVRNITQHVPVVIDHINALIGEEVE